MILERSSGRKHLSTARLLNLVSWAISTSCALHCHSQRLQSKYSWATHTQELWFMVSWNSSSLPCTRKLSMRQTWKVASTTPRSAACCYRQRNCRLTRSTSRRLLLASTKSRLKTSTICRSWWLSIQATSKPIPNWSAARLRRRTRVVQFPSSLSVTWRIPKIPRPRCQQQRPWCQRLTASRSSWLPWNQTNAEQCSSLINAS